MRKHELFSAAIIQRPEGALIEVPATRGSAAYRRIPVHPRLKNRPLAFNSTSGAITKRFTSKKHALLGAETHITSLNYALYGALIQNGIDCVDLVALTHGKEEAFWDIAVMDRLAVLFKQIDFGY